MMSLSMLLYDDNSNSCVVVAALPKYAAYQNGSKCIKQVCMYVHMYVHVSVCLNPALFSYL